MLFFFIKSKPPQCMFSRFCYTFYFLTRAKHIWYLMTMCHVWSPLTSKLTKKKPWNSSPNGGLLEQNPRCTSSSFRIIVTCLFRKWKRGFIVNIMTPVGLMVINLVDECPSNSSFRNNFVKLVTGLFLFTCKHSVEIPTVLTI